MLTSSKIFFKDGGRVHPVKPLIQPHWVKGSRQDMHFTQKFWQHLLRKDRARTSFWVSDFRHKYLIRTGRYYTGKVPESPPPGYMAGQNDTYKYLDAHPAPPDRETRHLPIMPLTPRVVHEHRSETEDAYFTTKRKYKRLLTETREMEFNNWYSRLQRVRGRWCREQNISSRGVYGPAVDASEIWG